MSPRVVRDIDKGFNAFFAELKDLKKIRVKVGIQGAEAPEIRPGGITMVDLGITHEFGAPPNIPQRSFLRSTADAKEAKYERMMKKSVKKLTQRPKTFNAKAEMFKLGETVRSDVIKTIKDRIPPANAPSTIAQKKGEDVPLIDTGQLINSLRSVVTSK